MYVPSIFLSTKVCQNPTIVNVTILLICFFQLYIFRFLLDQGAASWQLLDFESSGDMMNGEEEDDEWWELWCHACEKTVH